MKKFTVKEIESKVEGKLVRGNYEDFVQGLVIDSREVKPENCFVAIKGERTDGHNFLEEVAAKGCKTMVVSDESKAPKGECNVILVEDTAKALENFAKNYLNDLDVKKIAVTGSVGKTTTRDMIHAVCSQKFKTGKNYGNLNTTYGVPIAVSELDEGIEALVLEIGMDHKGEIDRLVHMIKPQIGVITNVGITHIENFNNKQMGIFNAKMEITNCFTEDDLLIVNKNSKLLNEANTKGNYRLETVGLDTDGNSTALISEIEDFGEEGIRYKLTLDDHNYDVRLFVPGAHNAINSALAILVGRELGIDVEIAIKGLQAMKLTDKRLDIINTKWIKIINDTYNACPDSMMSALKTLAATEGERRVAILGDMYELGPDTIKYHRSVGAYADTLGLNEVVGIGQLGAHIPDTMNNEVTEIFTYNNKEDFYKEMPNIIKKGDAVLVKASRGMEMETIVEKLKELFE